MKFRIRCEIECDQKMLGDTINGIVSRGNGRILDIKQADDKPWMRNTAPIEHENKVQKVHKVTLSAPSETPVLNHPAEKLEVYEAIITHGRIGQVRRSIDWYHYIKKCTGRNYSAHSFNGVLNILSQLGLMRRARRGYYVLDAILPVENAKGMIEKYNAEHRVKYGQHHAKPAKNWGNIFAT